MEKKGGQSTENLPRESKRSSRRGQASPWGVRAGRGGQRKGRLRGGVAPLGPETHGLAWAQQAAPRTCPRVTAPGGRWRHCGLTCPPPPAGMGKKDDPRLMQEWFRLVQEKNAMVRYESELMIL